MGTIFPLSVSSLPSKGYDLNASWALIVDKMMTNVKTQREVEKKKKPDKVWQ